jgi:hypothetical protein
LAAFEVRLTYGRIAAVTFLLLNFLFARTYVGKVLTENVGLPLGALGLAALLRAARTERPPSAISGIWMMTAALVARAGAFFVLPVLWVWTAIAFPRTPRARALVVAAAIASTMAGFAADRVTRGIVAAPTAVAFSNFSYTLYGVVTGNRGWTQVTRDHPYVTQLAEPELSREIYRRSFAAMRARPWRALVGVLKTWGDYFTPSSVGAFGFLASNQVIRVRQCCFALAIIGLAACVLRRRQAAYSLPLACIAGVLASVPFLPPVDADSMRAYAATIPVVSLIVGLGASAVWTMIGRLGPLRAADVAGARSDDHAVAPGVLLLLGGVAVAAAVVGPALIGLEAAGAPAAVFAAAPCPEGASAFYLDVVPGSVVNVVDDGAALRSGPRGLRQSDLRRNIVPLYPELKAEVSSLDAGTTIFTGPTLGTYRRGVWLFAKTADMPATRTTMRACARMVDNAWLRQYGFFRADSLQPVAPAPRAPQ